MTEPQDGLHNGEEVNPYQSPGWHYYTVDIRKLTFAEQWRLSNPITFLIGASLKLLRVPVHFASGMIYPVRLVRLTTDELPCHARDALRGSIASWEDQGFRLVSCHTIPTLGNETYRATLIGRDGLVVSQAEYFRDAIEAGKTDERTENGCLSKFSDTRFVVTTTSRRGLTPPPWFEVTWLPESSIAHVLEHHCGRLDAIGETPISVGDSQVDDLLQKLEDIAVEHFLARGLLVPMTPEEVAKAGPPRNLRP